jgi:tetratricopeptide (TPR) repeat protein
MGISVTTVAVGYFANNSGVNQYEYLGKALGDMLVTDLSSSATIRLVERDRLNELLRELDLSDTDFIDPSSAVRLGRGLGAQYVVLGSFTVFGERLRLDARILRTETSEVALAEGVEGPMSQFFDVQKDLGRRLLAAMDVSLSSREEAVFSVPQTRSLEALERFGMGLDAKDRGDDLAARRAFEAAIQVDPEFTRVSEVLSELEAEIRRVITRDYTDRAQQFMRRGEFVEAGRILNQAVDLNPRDGLAYYLRGVIQTESGLENEEAVRAALIEFDRSIANGHRTPASHYLRALVREDVGDLEGALRDYAAALRTRFDPTLLLVQGRDYSRSATDGGVTLGLTISDMGITYAELGQFRRAARTCQMGLEISPYQAGFDLNPLTNAEWAEVVERLLDFTDEPLDRSEISASIGEWVRAVRGSTAAELTPLMCLVRVQILEMEETGDASLEAPTIEWLRAFLDLCGFSNDRHCRAEIPEARGLLYELERNRGSTSLSRTQPLELGNECPFLLDRVAQSGRPASMPDEWISACIRELHDVQVRWIRAQGMVRPALDYYRDVGNSLRLQDWSEEPTALLRKLVEILPDLLWRSGSLEEGCEWWAEGAVRSITIWDLDQTAGRRGCVAPDRPRAMEGRLTFALSPDPNVRSIAEEFINLLLDWMNNMNPETSRALRATLASTQQMVDVNRCLSFRQQMFRGEISLTSKTNSIQAMAQRGGFRVTVADVQTADPPRECPVLQGFSETGGKSITLTGKIVLPEARGNGATEYPVTIRLFRDQDGANRTILVFPDGFF